MFCTVVFVLFFSNESGSAKVGGFEFFEKLSKQFGGCSKLRCSAGSPILAALARIVSLGGALSIGFGFEGSVVGSGVCLFVVV